MKFKVVDRKVNDIPVRVRFVTDTKAYFFEPNTEYDMEKFKNTPEVMKHLKRAMKRGDIEKVISKQVKKGGSE